MGRRILLTRAREQSEAMAGALEAEGWTPVIQPLLAFAPTGAAPDPAGCAALAFTSANGVRAAAALSGFAGRIYAVGAATAEAARAAGFANVIESAGDAGDLARLMLARGEAGPVLHLRGRHGAGGLAEALAAAGVPFRESVVYEMRAAERLDPAVAAAIRSGEIAVAPFYSARTAKIFAALVDSGIAPGLAATHAVAISEEVAKSLRNLGFASVEVAGTPSGEAMLDAIARLRR